MPRLVAIHYSPWSEKARWALDHHAINYREVAYLPMLGTPLLRLRMRRFSGKVSVPVLFMDDQAISDSYEIARYVDRVGSGASLFPDDKAEEVARYNTLSEQVCHAGRALATARTAADDDALQTAVPAQIPWPFKRAMGKLGVRYLENKYGLNETDEAGHRQSAREALLAMEQALEGKETVLDQFSFADIAMACALQLIWPVSDEHIRLGRHTRRCFTDDTLVAEFPNLGPWRDHLYKKYRGRL